jgi:hypothetical protein
MDAGGTRAPFALVRDTRAPLPSRERPRHGRPAHRRRGARGAVRVVRPGPAPGERVRGTRGGYAVGPLGIAVGTATAAVAGALALQGRGEPGWSAATAVLLGACAGGLVAGLEAIVAWARAGHPQETHSPGGQGPIHTRAQRR